MKIYCCSCKKYVGEVRDASLMKGIEYLCPTCKEELVPIKEEEIDYDIWSDQVDMLTKIFGMKK